MIRIPKEILTEEEILAVSGRAAKDTAIEIVNVSIEKKSLTLNVDVKLNFTLPKSLEARMKERLIARIGTIRKVRVEYIYESAQNGAPKSGRKSRAAKGGKAAADSSVHGDVLYGKKIYDPAVPVAEVFENVGGRAVMTCEGEIFQIDSRPTKKGSVIVKILIVDHMRVLPVKCFMTDVQFKALTDEVDTGDVIRASGFAEFDTFDNEVILRARSINKCRKIIREDNHEGPKRVELHVHTKMSDNDGFNEIEDLVDQAAAWGQPAVAITDHGVVQAFPDAASRAKKLAKKGKKIKIIYGMEGYLYPDENAFREDGTIDIKKNRPYHIILLAKNLTGLYNLYKLVSTSHIDYFYKRPRIPRSVLEAHRDGIIVGSACEAGEVYQAVLRGLPDDELLEIASYYDYLEIQPLGNNQFLVDENRVASRDVLIENNLKILELADRLGKMTVATTDSHYPTPESALYRKIIMACKGFTETNSDSLYLRTTDEMLAEFDYLGERAEEVVITNTNRIADLCEEFQPVPSGKYPPKIDGADETLRETCYRNAVEMYGDPIPEVIRDRLDTELNAIISNGYAVMYVAAQMLVQKSLSDGYLVGSRGSVGSSFAATMAGITEVNPLDPHYLCPDCKYLEWLPPEDAGKYDCGFDLPDKTCPRCGAKLRKQGLKIPFATFLGFEGNKEPDIDLNFAGEYQATAHRYVGEIFGEKNIYKAGTVATIADKTAYGHVKHYLEERGIPATKYDVDFLTRGCMGVKNTTGQHPGGIIIVPDDHEIYEFCPIQKPANKMDVDFITTHFDYHKIDKNLLKLDILGHDVPQMLRHLQLMTGVEPLSIPMDDPNVISIFTSVDALKIQNPEYKFTHGTYAIPEFGTNFTRQMLDDVRPTTVSALIKISGFSHGTDVWTGNAQDLVRNGTATIDEVISSRDDIMNYLQVKGLSNGDAFRIMEDVRKNRELTEEELSLMREHGVPDWYVWSCKTLQYLFPRAHASAYVMMAIRMAWFKVYYPPFFYAAWLTTKIDDFDINCIRNGMQSVESELQKMNNILKPTAKEKNRITVLEVLYEFYSRGFEFSMPELGVSDPCVFTVVDGKVKIPYMAVSGVGKAAAESLDAAFRERGHFTSLDDVRQFTRLSQTNIDDLKQTGVFDGIPDTSQISIFDLIG